MALDRLKDNKTRINNLGNKAPDTPITVGILKPSRFKFKKPKNISKRQKKVLALLLVFVLMGVVGWSIQKTFMKKSKLAIAVCSPELLKEASQLLEPAKHKELEPVVSRIQKLKNYDHDPNCLNIIITNNLNTGDIKNAQSNMKKLEKVYEPNKGFSHELNGQYVQNINTLRANITFLEKLAETTRKNNDSNPKLWTEE